MKKAEYKVGQVDGDHGWYSFEGSLGLCSAISGLCLGKNHSKNGIEKTHFFNSCPSDQD